MFEYRSWVSGDPKWRCLLASCEGCRQPSAAQLWPDPRFLHINTPKRGPLGFQINHISPLSRYVLLKKSHVIDSFDPATDIFIFDRLYYSSKLINILNKKGFGYIFRMKYTSNFFKGMALGRSKIFEYNGTDVQAFKYKITDQDYYILTSVAMFLSISEIVRQRWLRWKVETDIKKIKYDVLTSRIRSKNYNSLRADLACIKFICVLSSFIDYYGNLKCKTGKKVNSSSCINALYNEILKVVFYKKRFKADATRIVKIIYEDLVDIVKGRSYPRVRKSPSSNWNNKGNKYGRHK